MDKRWIGIIEDWVNSAEGIEILEKGWAAGEYNSRWDRWIAGLGEKLGLLRLTYGKAWVRDLVDDVFDWEHNGNLRVWEDDEVNDFGMTKWTYNPNWADWAEED